MSMLDRLRARFRRAEVVLPQARYRFRFLFVGVDFTGRHGGEVCTSLDDEEVARRLADSQPDGRAWHASGDVRPCIRWRGHRHISFNDQGAKA